MANPKAIKRRSTFGGVVYNTTIDVINIWALINFFQVTSWCLSTRVFIREVLDPFPSTNFNDDDGTELLDMMIMVIMKMLFKPPGYSAFLLQTFDVCSRRSVARKKLNCKRIILREGEKGREVFRPVVSPVSSCFLFFCFFSRSQYFSPAFIIHSLRNFLHTSPHYLNAWNRIVSLVIIYKSCSPSWHHYSFNSSKKRPVLC